MRSGWTWPLCEGCWNELHPDRIAHRVISDKIPEQCCNCGSATVDGIWIRRDPKEVNFG